MWLLLLDTNICIYKLTVLKLTPHCLAQPWCVLKGMVQNSECQLILMSKLASLLPIIGDHFNTFHPVL